MNWSVRFTDATEEDLNRLHDFFLDRPEPDWLQAEKAMNAIKNSIQNLAATALSCRLASADHPTLRELIIPFGRPGYVALFEVKGSDVVTILAVRHQREGGYH